MAPAEADFVPEEDSVPAPELLAASFPAAVVVEESDSSPVPASMGAETTAPISAIMVDTAPATTAPAATTPTHAATDVPTDAVEIAAATATESDDETF